MESIHKATLIGLVLGMLLVTILTLGCYYISCVRQVNMAKLGYEQARTIGTTDYVWQKAK
jgi:hypothetical protein